MTKQAKRDPKRARSSAGGAFARFELRHELNQAIEAAGYEEPRPIQSKGIPPAMQGRDVLGLAQTGTGKTAAFVLPALHHLLVDRHPALRVLVVTPTRELASQVHGEFERLGQFTPLKSVVIFGGVPASKQIRALRQKPDVVVACPGRLLDLANQGEIKLKDIEILVLDEADHMFDMGFLPDVRRILKLLPKERQNLLFSATMAKEIRRLADDVLYKPAVIELANTRPAETIDHVLVPTPEPGKQAILEELLDGDDFRSAIVFTRTKHRARRLAKKLDTAGYKAIALQGNMSQGQRVRALAGFKDGTYDVMVATDIAARGLDIEDVSHVINFDVPTTPDAYTHRIGRTGRSERSGLAYTFVTGTDDKQVRDIEKRLGGPIERVRMGARGGAATGGRPTANQGGGPRPSSRRGGGPRRGGGRGRPGGGQRPRSDEPVGTNRPAKAAPKRTGGPSFGAGLGHADQPERPSGGSSRRGGGRRRRSRGRGRG